jgi:probable F420-dependent oxidoreductase
MERKIGVILPRELIRGKELMTLATEVESMGYDYVVACDHIVLPDQNEGGEKLKYSLREKYTDPLILLSAIAAVTNKIELFTGVLILPERPTALVARQAADVDIISDGRFKLGVGVGWLKSEFDALAAGAVFSYRGKRIEEQISLLRQLWTQPIVSTTNSQEQLDSVGINPRPIQQPIPIWMGGTDPKVIDRTVRMADGWIPRGKAIEFNDEFLPNLERSLNEHQRDTLSLPVMGKVNVRWESGENNWKKEGDDWLQSNKVTHLSVGSIGGENSHTEEHLEILEKAISYFK